MVNFMPLTILVAVTIGLLLFIVFHLETTLSFPLTERTGISLLFKCSLIVLLVNRASFFSIDILFHTTRPCKILEFPTILFSETVPYPTMHPRFHMDLQVTTVSKLTSTTFHWTLNVSVFYFFCHLYLILRSNLIEKITIIIGTA